MRRGAPLPAQPRSGRARPARPRPSEGAAGRVTIAQIAQASGVSPATVSKVLNGRGDVSAATRERVQGLIAAHGYRRRGVRTLEAPPLVDLVFNEFHSPWAVEMTRGAMGTAQAAGFTVALTSLSEGQERKVWFDHITARGTRGVVLLLSRFSPAQRAELHSRRLPFVVIDPRGEPPPEVVSVGATNWSGGLSATRHLVELGHERIGVISGPRDLLSSRARLDGYRAALETAGLPVDPTLARSGDFLVEGGFKGAMALLSLPRPPTAIFAGSDLQALGVLEAARLHGRRVPEDLSLVGFDDLPLSAWTSPPLTTIRQPLAEMAALAVRLVLAMGRGEEPANPRIELATSLLVRESTAAVR